MSRLIFAQLAHVAALDALKGEHFGHMYDPSKRTKVTEDSFAHLSQVSDAWSLRAGLYDYDATRPMPLTEADLDDRSSRDLLADIDDALDSFEEPYAECW